MPTTTAPGNRAKLPPAVLKALRAAGYLSEAQETEPEEPEADADRITDEAAPASDGGA